MKNRKIQRVVESLERQREAKGASFCAETTFQAFKKGSFATAADWVIELTPGVHFRYTCARCDVMPLKSSDFFR
eukprot:9981173-Lingulodinium_polyedra.AAC.1